MVIRQPAFTGENRLLKGALHCHTTRSDGRVSPEDTIRLHKQNGYDFMALTDHRFYNFQNFAPDVDMTIIPGMEFDSTFYHDKGFRCFHTVCLGPVEGNGFAQDQRFESGKSTNQEEYQKYLDWLHENNNLTVYCHPEWSGTAARHFDKLRGNFAMEIWNTGCAMENEMDTNAAYWDEILGAGARVFGVAVDDGHQPSHHCKGWVRVNAQNEVNDILASLRAGAFYSSCGPEIYDFYVDGGHAYARFSECESALLVSDAHPSQMRRETATAAMFDVNESHGYVRLVVKDALGRRAWSNPIWME